jgi:hypothetical protein
MNFNEVLELHKAVSVFHENTPRKRPKLGVFDLQNREEGYILCVRRNGASKDFLGFLINLAETRNLSIREFRDYLILYSVETN